MNLSFKDLPALGKPLLVLAIVLAVCVAAIMYSARAVKQAQVELVLHKDSSTRHADASRARVRNGT